MNSNMLNFQTSFDEMIDFDMIDEWPSINKLSIGSIHKNPLLTNKGKVLEKDVLTFRESNENLKWPNIINYESWAVSVDFSSSISEWSESSDWSKDNDCDHWESLENVFWIRVNNIKRRPISFKFSNEMTSQEILKELRL